MLACDNHLVYIARARCMHESGFNYYARLSMHAIIIVATGAIIIAWYHFESRNKSDTGNNVTLISFNLCTTDPFPTFVLWSLDDLCPYGP